MRVWLLIFLGGGVGSMVRFAVSLFLTNRFGTGFPYGTLSVNICGSFMLGIIIALCGERVNVLSEEWRFLLAVGFCGGFTTFSTLSLELFTMLQSGRVLPALVYIGVSLVCGIASIGAGLGLVYWWNKMRVVG
jgi:fluoride exporter